MGGGGEGALRCGEVEHDQRYESCQNGLLPASLGNGFDGYASLTN